MRILGANRIEDKLFTPSSLTDYEPGSAYSWTEPVRPAGMHFRPHTKRDKLPALHDMAHSDKRADALHRFCGHELLAVEIMANALLCFPNAPKHFRRGLANTLIEEQGHVKLYMQRLKAMGVTFGDLPLFKHFWALVPQLTTPERYVSAMSLTFEMANLDFAPMYREIFSSVDDQDSAALMQQILEDEVAHVSFGYHWLNRWKHVNESDWEAWLRNLPPSLQPRQARGKRFQQKARERAGISMDWIANLRNS